MPKIRPAGASLADMLKHGRVFQARIGNTPQHQEYARSMTDAMVILQKIQKNFPTNEEDINYYSDEELNSASSLINKEAKKNVAKMKPIDILRAMHNATNQIDAIKIGLKQGITQEQIKNLIKKAPLNTPLGKVIAAKMAKQVQSTPMEPPAAVQPITPITPQANNGFEQQEEEEQQNTINSDYEADEELKRLLGGE